MPKVVINNKLDRRLTKLSQSEQKKIQKVIQDLGLDPFPKNRDLKKLRSTAVPLWRIRIGDLRIVYSFSPDSNIIRIADINFRGNIY